MSTTVAPKPIVYCHYSLDQIKESGLISPERIAAVEKDIESRISGVFDKNQMPIRNALLADHGDGKRFLYHYMEHDPNWDYMKRQMLAFILTQEELALIEKSCFSAFHAQKEAKQFEKAIKVPLDEHEGACWWGDQFFHNVSDALDAIVSDHDVGDDWPTYLWAAEPTRVIPALDASDVIDHYIEDRGWEDMDVYDLNGVAELNVALTRFAEANENVISYQPDHDKAILLDGVDWEDET